MSTVVKTARLKDKVTVAQEETMPNIWNGTVWCPWLTSIRVARVCQHQLSFLLFLLTAKPVLGRCLFYSKTGFWPSYCQISIDLDKILHTPIVVRNTPVGRLRPRSARGRFPAKPKRR